MKARYVLLWIGALVAGVWYGRAAWRAHRELVTLHVRNVPLRDVLRKIERQTWSKIRAEQDLDTRITLTVTDKPLSYVLDRLCEQAGGRWVTVHAVYGSARALEKLESAMRGDGKIEAAGWTRIAPGPLTLGTDGRVAPPEEQANGIIPAREAGRNTSLPPGAVVTTETEDVVMRGSGDPTGKAQSTLGMQRPTRVVVMRRGGAGPDGAVEEEVWTPEEVVMESSLSGRPEVGRNLPPTPVTAGKLAKTVEGDWTTYLALRKARLGIGLTRMPGGHPAGRPIQVHRGPGPESHAENVKVAGEPPGPPALDLEGDLLRQRYAEFGRLTPEQRVQRARERQALGQRETNHIN